MSHPARCRTAVLAADAPGALTAGHGCRAVLWVRRRSDDELAAIWPMMTSLRGGGERLS